MGVTVTVDRAPPPNRFLGDFVPEAPDGASPLVRHALAQLSRPRTRVVVDTAGTKYVACAVPEPDRVVHTIDEGSETNAQAASPQPRLGIDAHNSPTLFADQPFC